MQLASVGGVGLRFCSFLYKTFVSNLDHIPRIGLQRYKGLLTCAASAALLRASPAGGPPPSVRPGPPTFGGTEALGAAAGVGVEDVPSTRPGWEKGSDGFAPREQMLPIVTYNK